MTDGTDHYIYRRAVPEIGPGVEIFVAQMIFNDRLMIGIPTLSGYRVDDYWCYSPGRAIPAAVAWDPLAEPNGPTGWKKRGSTGEYRDDTGNPEPALPTIIDHEQGTAA